MPIGSLAPLLDSLPLGAAWLDTELRVRFCNRWLEGWLGNTREALINQPFLDILDPAAATLSAPMLRQVLGGDVAVQPLRIKLPPPARARTLQMRYQPHREADGSVIGVLISASETISESERRLAQEAHEIAEAQRVARIGTYRTDLKRGTWTASDGFCRIFGFEPGGVYTMEEFQQIVHPDELDEVMAYFGQCIANREPFDLEYRCVKRDTGEVIDVRSTSQIFYDEADVPDRITGIKQDITERKQLERQLLASQRMEALGQLAGGIAHDFNNLLTAILGFNELAADGLPGDPVGSFLKQVEDAGQRAQRLTRQLLAFSRQRAVRPTPLDLNEIVSGIDRLLGQLIGGPIELRTVLGEGLWNTAVDPSAIEQVLVNLAVNARDAMPSGGLLTLETSNVSLDAPHAVGLGEMVAPGDYVRLAVTDTGTGIAAETLPHIFEPFFTTKQTGGGTGLGLSTCYGLVTQVLGGISVYSEPDQGTTFKVYLPRSVDTIRPAAPSCAEPVLAGTETVLVVEDDDAVRELARFALEHQGYTVSVVRDGAAALDWLRSDDRIVDLVLTDMVMPGLSGQELAEAVRDQHPGIRVLFMSGYTGNAISQWGVLPPDVTLLEKPFTQESLGAKVREVLDS